jgi:hypothetical protein
MDFSLQRRKWERELFRSGLHREVTTTHFLPTNLLQYLRLRIPSLSTNACHGRISVMFKRRQLGNFTATRLAGLCRIIAASPSVDNAIAERARLLKLDWEALQANPTTYSARREHHRVSKELQDRMVEFLATL